MFERASWSDGNGFVIPHYQSCFPHNVPFPLPHRLHPLDVVIKSIPPRGEMVCV